MLADDVVCVLRFDLLDPRWTSPERTLGPAERARAARFRFESDRDQYLRAHAGLRQALGSALEIDPAAVDFVEGPHRKPELADGACRFSLSHAAGLALVALCRNRPLGVDLERVREGPEAEVQRFLSGAEQAAISALPQPTRREAFFRAWVRKEAYLKARGTGLTVPLEDFDVSVSPDAPAALLATRPDPAEAARWSMAEVPVRDGWLGALVVAAGPFSLSVDDAAPPG